MNNMIRKNQIAKILKDIKKSLEHVVFPNKKLPKNGQVILYYDTAILTINFDIEDILSGDKEE